MNYEANGEVTIAVQAIEELLFCAAIEFGADHPKIKRLDDVAFSMKVSLPNERLGEFYRYAKEQLDLQLGEGVVEYLQLIAK